MVKLGLVVSLGFKATYIFRTRDMKTDRHTALPFKLVGVVVVKH